MLTPKLYGRSAIEKLTNEVQDHRKRIMVCVTAHLREDLPPHLKRQAAVWQGFIYSSSLTFSSVKGDCITGWLGDLLSLFSSNDISWVLAAEALLKLKHRDSWPWCPSSTEGLISWGKILLGLKDKVYWKRVRAQGRAWWLKHIGCCLWISGWVSSSRLGTLGALQGEKAGGRCKDEKPQGDETGPPIPSALPLPSLVSLWAYLGHNTTVFQTRQGILKLASAKLLQLQAILWSLYTH